MAKKLYYKIGEACKRLDIQPYVLRYWETEFPLLSPDKSTSGQRVYSEQDLRVIQRIKELLYEEGYTIAGAKKKLEKQDLASLGELREIGVNAEDLEEETPDEPDDEIGDDLDEDAGRDDGGSETAAKTESATGSRSKGRSKKKKKAPGGDGGASEAKLRRGIRAALEEARAILDLLDS